MYDRSTMFMRGLLIVFTLVLLGACSVPFLTNPNEAPKIYLLEWEQPKPAVFSPERASIQIMPLRAAPGVSGDAIVYVRTPHQLEHYSRHRWADAPAKMLEPLLVRALESSGLFSAVAGPDTRVRTDLRLEGKLLRLQQVFEGKNSKVLMALRITLIKTKKSRLIATRVIEVSEPVTVATPYGAVKAANRATQRLLAAVKQFVTENI